MSAWIVSKTHIDLLVTAASMYGKGRLVVGSAQADEVGRMLWAENLASVAYRYPQDVSGTRPGPIGFEDSEVEAYRFERVPGVVFDVAVIVVVLNSLACYEYQSCEHSGWEGSEARKFCERLRRYCGEALPGYDEASWGFDDRNSLMCPDAGCEEAYIDSVVSGR